MDLSIICFTGYGLTLARRIRALLTAAGYYLQLCCKAKSLQEEAASDPTISYVEESIGEWAAGQLRQGRGLLFIGATGIAVRAIAPGVCDKLTDPPVLVMDDCGRYVIPLLSGHMGGANEMALLLGELLGAEPVITTATDNHGAFAVDLFAKKQELTIADRSCIAACSSRILAGQRLTLVVEDRLLAREEDRRRYEQFGAAHEQELAVMTAAQWQQRTAAEGEKVDLWIGSREQAAAHGAYALIPREYCLGMGCRRGKPLEELAAFAEEMLKTAGIDRGQLACLTSIDRKADETGLQQLAREYRMTLLTYPAEELLAVKGEFSSSAFVQKQVGVDCVCERAAACAAGEDYELILPKQAKDGMTGAVAKKIWRWKRDE